MAANVQAIHFDSSLWGEDANEFKPDRFLDESDTQEDAEDSNNHQKRARHPMAFIPFGAGPRICPGMKLAVFEIKLFVLAVISKYELSVCDRTQVVMKGIRILGPEKVELRMTKRE